MPPQYKEQLTAPMAWRGSELAKEKVAFDLSARQVAALEDVLARVEKAGLPMRETGLEQARHPALDSALAKVFDEQWLSPAAAGLTPDGWCR